MNIDLKIYLVLLMSVNDRHYSGKGRKERAYF